MTSSCSHLRLKCRFESEIRTVIVNVDKVDWAELRRRLSSDFGFEVSLKYEDIDGDHITLSSQNDFEGLVHGRYVNETVNVFVTPCKPLPDLKRTGTISREESMTSMSNMSRESSLASLTGEGSLSPTKKSLTIETTPASDESSQYQDIEKCSANSVDMGSSALHLRSPSSLYGFASPMSPLATRDRTLARVPSFNSSSNLNFNYNGPPGTSGSMTGDINRERSGSLTSLASSGGDPSENQIRWKKGEMLGQGAFGVVYLGLNQDSGELMAVKQLSREEVSGKEINSLENEIKLLQTLWHPNIVRYIGTEINNSTLSIFLEYVPGGSLKALIDKFGALEESVTQTYTRQLLLGLEYLHNNGIAHRDIKGGNCLVGNDGVIKLADFGNSKHWRAKAGNGMKAGGSEQHHSSGTSNDIKGTPSWMAPEVIKEQGSRSISWRKADVWSLACTTLEMASGKAPWSQFSNSVTILYHIACQETLPEYPQDASMELNSFLSMCLQREPAKRPDTSSLLLHPFVAKMAANGWNTAAGVMGCVVRPSTVGESRASIGLEMRDRDSKYGREQRGRPSLSAVRRGVEESDGETLGDPAYSNEAKGGAQNSANAEKSTSGGYLEESESTELASKSSLSAAPEASDVGPYLDDSGGVDGDRRRTLVTTLNPNMGMDVPLGLEGVYDDSGEAPGDEGVSLEKSEDALEVSEEIETPRILSKSAIITARTEKGTMDSTIKVRPMEGDGSYSKKKMNITDNLEDSGTSSDTLMSSENNAIDPEVSHPRPKPISNPLAIEEMQLHQQQRSGEEKTDSLSPRPKPIDSGTMSPFPSMPDLNNADSSSDLDVGISPRARDNPPLQYASPKKHVVTLSPSVKDKKLSPSARRAVARGRALSEVELDPLTPEEKQRILQQRLQRQAATERLKGLQNNARVQASPVNVVPVTPTVGRGSHLAALGSGPLRPSPVMKPGVIAAATQRTGTALLASDVALISDGSNAPRIAGRISRSDSLDSFDQSETSLSGVGMYDGDSLSSVSGGEPNFLGRDKATPASLEDDSTDATDADEPRWHVPSDFPQEANMSSIQKSGLTKFSDSPIRQNSTFAQSVAGLGFGSMAVSRGTESPSLDPPQLIRSTSKIDTSVSEKSVRFASSSRMVNNPGLKLIIPDSMDNKEHVENESAGPSEVQSGDAKKSQHYIVPANHVPGVGETNKFIAGEDASKHNLNYDGQQQQQQQQSASNLASLGDGNRAIYQPHRDRLKVIPQSPIRPLNKSLSSSAIGSPKVIHEDSLNSEKVFSRAPTRGPPRVKKQSHPASAHPRIGRGILRDDGRDLFHGTGFEYPGDSRPDPLQTLEMSAKVVKPGFASAPEASRRANKSSQGTKKRLNTGIRLKTEENGYSHNDFSPQGCSSSSSPITFENRKKLSDRAAGDSVASGFLDGDGADVENEDENAVDNDEEETDFFDDGDDITGPQRLLEHDQPVTRLRAPRRTELLISSSIDGTVKVWGPERRSKMTLDATEFNLPGFSGSSSEKFGDSTVRTGVVNVWAEENCETIWGACSDHALRVWDGGNGQGLRFLKGHTHGITAMEGLDRIGKGHGGGLVGTGSADKTVRVWDARAKKGQVFLFKGHSDAVITLRWGEGGRSLVTGGKDKTIRIWDTRAGRLRALCERHFDAVNALRAIPEYIKCSTIDGEAGASFVSGGRDSSINLWTADGDCVGSQTCKNRSSIIMLSDINANLAFRSGVPFLFSLSSDNNVRLWDLRRFKFATEFSATGPMLVKAVWAGQSIFTASSSGDIQRWFPSATPHIMQTEQVSTKEDITWQNQQLLSHNTSATDIISTEKFVASSSKSGEIIRFWGS